MHASIFFTPKPLPAPIRVKSHYTPTTVSDPLKGGGSMAAPKWAQKTLTIPAQKRGCHLITSKILAEIGQDLSGFKCGLAHFFLQHTSASLTINENYDSDVRDDTETFLNRIVPEGPSAPWKHTLEDPTKARSWEEWNCNITNFGLSMQNGCAQNSNLFFHVGCMRFLPSNQMMVPNDYILNKVEQWQIQAVIPLPSIQICKILGEEDVELSSFWKKDIPLEISFFSLVVLSRKELGPDDMPAHIKSSMFGCSLSIPITNGQLNMGTWQGIWLCEHRDYATPRKVVVTLNGI